MSGVTPCIQIDGRPIGPDHPVYIVAELSANHKHDLGRARALVHAAKAAGADAVKLQTYTADTLTIPSDAPPFRIHGTGLWDGRTLHDLYQEAHMPWEWQAELKALCDTLGLACFSTPFDASAVDFCESLGMPAHKIASFEIVDLPLLGKVAATGKPVLLSTGMATLGEIDEAVTTLRGHGAKEIALLKCTSAYPASPSDMNLRTLPHLGAAFGAVPGLSDHTLGVTVPVAAVALGACLIEKHFTLARKDGGPDAAFSLEPDELKALVEAVRTTEQALGRVHYGVTAGEAHNRMFRRSLFVVEDVRAGEPFTTINVRAIRPGQGLHTRHLGEVLGRQAACDIVRGTPLAWALVAGAAR